MPNATQVTLKQLRYFSRIVELGSISRASHDLHIAQTALGLQVRTLEDCLGVSLLLRHPKGVLATDEGKFVYARTKEIIGSVDDLVAEVRARVETRPRDIWLGLAPNIMHAIGAQAVVLQEDHLPGLRLHLLEGSRNGLLDDVRIGELDWAIVHEAEETEDFRIVPIMRESVLLVSRPDFVPDPGPISLRDVLARDLVLDSGRRVISGVLSRAAKKIGLEVNLKYEIDSIFGVKQMILNENVSGILTREIVKDEIRRGEFQVREITDPPLEITAFFVARAHEAPTAHDLPVLSFIDALVHDFCKNSGEQQLSRIASIVGAEAA